MCLSSNKLKINYAVTNAYISRDKNTNVIENKSIILSYFSGVFIFDIKELFVVPDLLILGLLRFVLLLDDTNLCKKNTMTHTDKLIHNIITLI